MDLFKKKFKALINNIQKFFHEYEFNYKVNLILIGMFILGLFIGTTLARFVYNGVKNGFLLSQSFYFNSDKLGVGGSTYRLNNWSGADSYTIPITMNSLKNNLLGATSDINYTISYSCSSNLLCSVDKDHGTILSSLHSDTFNVMITPNATFSDGDEASLTVSASSTSPYIKTLSATFTFVVGQAGLSYLISDEAGRPYLELRITNTLDYYTVNEAFDSYSIGTRIDAVTYTELSAGNKAKCTSAEVVLTFDPEDVVLDMTTSAYLKGYNFTNTNVDHVSYVNGISFKMDALSSELVTFYKYDIDNDYTYPITNPSSVINVLFNY